MNRFSLIATWVLAAMMLAATGCDEGTNDWNSSAKISGYVLESVGNPAPIPNVKVIIESDQESDVPYQGPDRWFLTDENGYFEGFIFLGNDQNVNGDEYVYVADLSVGYFMDGAIFRWTGGITVGPGTHFTLPTVYRDMFTPFTGETGQ